MSLQIRDVVFAALAMSAAATASGATPKLMHYRIGATILHGTGQLESDVTITLPPNAMKQDVAFILGRRFRLQPVTATPRASVATQNTDKPTAGLQKISVHFDSQPTRPATLHFVYQGDINVAPDQGRLGYTPDAIEMSMELMWLPFPSEINERFTVDATIHGVPQSFVVVAQGDVRHEGDRVNIRRTQGDLDFAWVAVRGLQSVMAPGIEFYARDLQDPLAQVLRKHALAAAKFHQEWFGPLPGGPIRLAVVPRKGGGAYARTGYTIMAEGRAAGDPAVNFIESDRAANVAHEFAHAWWAPADPLTEDYWLAESFAQYAAFRYYESAFGRAEFEKLLAMVRDASKSAAPVLGHGRPSRASLYQKGPVLLFDLENRIGRRKMDRILGTLARHPPRETREFLNELSTVAGAEVAADFEHQLRTQ